MPVFLPFCCESVRCFRLNGDSDKLSGFDGEVLNCRVVVIDQDKIFALGGAAVRGEFCFAPTPTSQIIYFLRERAYLLKLLSAVEK